VRFPAPRCAPEASRPGGRRQTLKRVCLSPVHRPPAWAGACPGTRARATSRFALGRRGPGIPPVRADLTAVPHHPGTNDDRLRFLHRRLGEPTGPHLLIDAEHRVDRLRFLLHDRDSKFTAAFDAVFTALGIEMFRTRPHAPRANGLAERWIGTVAASAPTGYRSGATGICAWCWTSTFATTIITIHTPCQQPPNSPESHELHVDADGVKRRPILGGLINGYAQAA
jgi:transposase InsO family protein